MLRFHCPACNKSHEAPDNLAGTKGPCPSCGQRLQFPFPVAVIVVEKPKPTVNDPVMVQFACPCCGMQLSAPENCAGRSTKCRACGQPVTVPLPAVAAPTQIPPAKQPLPALEKPVPVTPAVGPKHRKAIIAGIATIFGVGCLSGCCSASVVFWAFPRGQSVLPEGIKGAAQRVVGEPPKDDMTFQQLEDRLNAGGLTVTRTESKKFQNTMWFGRDINLDAVGRRYAEHVVVCEGNNANDPWHFAELLGYTEFAGYVRVTKHLDAKAAQAASQKVTDIQQRPGFSWGPFSFEGNQSTLDNVKTALNR